MSRIDVRRFLVPVLVVLCGAGVAWAQSAGSAAPAPSEQWTKKLPVSFGVDYTLVSDYIFRGINFSEYPGEGQEKLNHQLGVNASVDTPVGTFGGYVWFEWFAGQKHLTPSQNTYLQEVDYNVHYAYTLRQTGTTGELGWTAYTFPPLSGDAYMTNEWYVKLSQDDSKLFGTKKPVLNPYFLYAMDLDQAAGDSWMELGVNHDFALADLGMAQTPVLKDITLTPALVLGIDHRYLDKFAGVPGASPGTRFAFLNYGLGITYDLASALKLPKKYANSLSVTGFLNYSEPFERKLLNDQLYGGVTLSYSW